MPQLELPLNPVPFRKGAKWGLVQYGSQAVILEPSYNLISRFYQGFSLVEGIRGNGFINANGEVTIPLEYNDMDHFSDGLAAYKENGKWGYMDKVGHIKIKPRFDLAGYFTDGYAVIGQRFDECSYEFGIIDKEGYEIIPATYESVSTFHKGLAIAKKDNKFGFINRQDEQVIPFIFDYAYYFPSGLALVRRNGKCFGIDQQGNYIINYPGITTFGDVSNGIFPVQFDEKWTLMTLDGDIILPKKFDHIQSFREGLASASLNRQYGFLDMQFKMVVKNQYQYAGSFYEGLAKVCIRNKFGFIKQHGIMAIPNLYEPIDDDFENSIVWVSNHNCYGYIDKKGKQYWENE